MLIGSDVTGSNIAYHHNLFAHHLSRLPRLGNETGAVNNVEWSNNVVFEGKGYSGTDQLANANFAGNTYLRHNSSNPEVCTGATGTSAYLSGNRADHNGDADADGYRNVEEYLDYAAQGSPALPTSPTTSTSPVSGTCAATYRTANSWSGGFQGEVTVTAGRSGGLRDR
ncbi:hypothetical protein Aca07nite_01080 [Actinoplanes capillaceus]|uniref:Right handed beta helix region n=1 Tax=Actinoplanes campanulatus TaxID=113559 RepID=A0ABQ3W9I5_9ACTN|nr:hypothetical protein [Actinoplanes capillaceus]GID42833.1 hypothetical protein Aca07nite_01080 [Actinoplanes capillaceus]